VASGITGAFVYFFRGNIYQERVDDAPTKFVQRLDALIKRAIDEASLMPESTRGDCLHAQPHSAGTQALLTQLFNSDNRHVGDTDCRAGAERIVIERLPASTQAPAPGQLFETIRVLQRTWRRSVMSRIGVRKLLCDTGT